jgi:hypothetical protein
MPAPNEMGGTMALSEVEITETSAATAREADELKQARQFVPEVPKYTYLRSNFYVNRPRRFCVEGSADFGQDIMECQCAQTGGGCADDSCLNRMSYYECLPSCKDPHCDNQRFQKRQYATLEVFHTPGKGYGLQSPKDVEEGDFIIEYSGEILDAREFRRCVRPPPFFRTAAVVRRRRG